MGRDGKPRVADLPTPLEDDMAVLSNITCARCGHQREVCHSHMEERPKVCYECHGTDVADARAAHLAQMAALPIEDRLALVEAWIYDHRPVHVPPPTF